jgi:hypothetical protein
MPLVQALPLGLILVGSTTVTFADGSTGARLTALGTIHLESGVSKIGVVILEPDSSDLLVGMEFLNQFQRTLVLIGDRAIPEPLRASAKHALLVDNDFVRFLLDEVGKYAAKVAREQADRAAQPKLPLVGPVPPAPSHPPDPTSN